MFGQNNSPFGSSGTTGGFGQPSSTPAFGQAPAPTGLFGSPPPQPQPFGQPQQPSAFGGGGFGQPAPAPSLFGAPQPAPAFGAPVPAFGSPAPAFGAPAAPSTGLFGAPAPAPTGGMFGAPAPSISPFGGPSMTTGSTFGMPAPAPAFGAPSTFGAPAPSGGGLFGAAPAPAFGQVPAPSGGLFGSAPAPFGQAPAPSSGFGFGGTAPAPSSAFGAPSTFGTPAPAPFGAPAPSVGLFGSPSTTAPSTQEGTRHTAFQPTMKEDGNSRISLQSITGMPQYENQTFESLRVGDYKQGNKGTPSSGNSSGGMFGAPAPSGGLFGSTAPAPSTFGAAPAPSFGSTFGSTPAPAFGQTPAPSTGFGFGTPAPAPSGGLFGSSAPAPAFGQSPAPSSAFGFGSPAPAPTSGFFGSSAPAPAPFGAPAPSSGLFGSTPAPAFGQSPAPSSGFGFGAPAPAPSGGLFGSSTPAPSGGLFGAPPASAGGFGFGSPAPAPAFGFGGQPPGPAPAAPQPAPAAQTSLFPANTQIIVESSNQLLEQKLRAIAKQKEELEKGQALLTGGSSISPAVTPRGVSESQGLTFFGRSPLVYGNRTPTSDVKILPRGFPKLESARKTSPMSISTPATQGRGALMSPEATIHSSRLKLRIDKESASKPRLRNPIMSPPPSLPVPNSNGSKTELVEPESERSDLRNGLDSPELSPVDHGLADRGDKQSSPAFRYYQNVIGADAESPGTATPPGGVKKSQKLPILSKEEYECKPPLSELMNYTEVDLATVPRFSVIRPGYGMVEWVGQVDVRGVDIDRAVVIEKAEVSVYEADESDGTKPPEGTKLNRAATVSLFDVFPKNGPQSNEEEFQRFEDRLQKSARTTGSEFVSYDRKTGLWVFKVQHFSRYGLIDEDDSDGVDENATTQGQKRVTFGPIPEGLEPLNLQRKQTPFKSYGLVSTDSIDEDLETPAHTMVPMNVDEAIMSLRAHVEPGSADSSMVGDEDMDPEDAWCVDDDDDMHLAELYAAELANESFENHEFKTFSRDIAEKLGYTRSSLDNRTFRPFRCGWSSTLSTIKIEGDRVKSLSPHVESSLSLFFQSELLELLVHHSDQECLEGQPLLQLPLSKRMGGSDQSHESLRNLLDEFSGLFQGKSEFSSVVLLICTLVDFDEILPMEGDSESFDHRRRNAILGWLAKTSYRSSNSFPDSQHLSEIFLAYAAGDIRKAANVAFECGMSEIGELLCLGIEGKRELSIYLESLVSTGSLGSLEQDRLDLLRAICLSTDIDFSPTAAFLDWRCHLALRLMRSNEKELIPLLSQFFDDVGKNIPFPSSRGENPSTPCSSYQILKSILGTESALPCLLDPQGMGNPSHDFSSAFFVAALLDASFLEITPSLFAQIVDGYSSQLICSGRWDLAVTVNMVSGKARRFGCLAGKLNRSKEIVLRHYREGDASHREYLVSIGVPKCWFDECMSRRAACEGKLLPSIQFLLGSSDEHLIESSRKAFENKYMPASYFLDSDSFEKDVSDASNSMLPSSFIEGMRDYIEVVHSTDAIFADIRTADPEEASLTKEKIKMLQADLGKLIHSLEDEPLDSVAYFPNNQKAIPSVAMLQDALSHLNFLEIQMGAVIAGVSLCTPRNVASQRLSLGDSSIN